MDPSQCRANQHRALLFDERQLAGDSKQSKPKAQLFAHGSLGLAGIDYRKEPAERADIRQRFTHTGRAQGL